VYASAQPLDFLARKLNFDKAIARKAYAIDEEKAVFCAYY
jgi:hypothetical protein